jgi:hypothetical protein
MIQLWWWNWSRPTQTASATLSWAELPEDTMAVYVRAYEIVDEAYVLVAEVPAGIVEVTFPFVATPGTHRYVLRTVDSVGNESDISEIIELIITADETEGFVWSSTECVFSVEAPEIPVTPPEPIASVINPYVILQFSDDGGFTWSQEHWIAVGRVGEFKKRMKWNRLGRSKNRTFKIVVSDPCRWIFTGCLIDAEQGTSRG